MENIYKNRKLILGGLFCMVLGFGQAGNAQVGIALKAGTVLYKMAPKIKKHAGSDSKFAGQMRQVKQNAQGKVRAHGGVGPALKAEIQDHGGAVRAAGHHVGGFVKKVGSVAGKVILGKKGYAQFKAFRQAAGKAIDSAEGTGIRRVPNALKQHVDGKGGVAGAAKHHYQGAKTFFPNVRKHLGKFR